MMSKLDPLVMVLARNAFYRRLHYLALAALALTSSVIIALICVIVFLLQNPTHPLFFATDSVGRLIPIIPVNTPNMTTDDVIDWTTQGVESALSYDYVNFRSQLQSAQKYFTRYGWTNYMNALRGNNNLVALTNRKMVVLAKVVEKPKILAQGILAGSYAWKFQMPVLVTYLLPPNYEAKFSNPLDVTVIVQRQQVLQGYKGLGIVQLIGTFASAPAPQQPQISAAPTG